MEKLIKYIKENPKEKNKILIEVQNIHYEWQKIKQIILDN
jgi:hypothetical protein